MEVKKTRDDAVKTLEKHVKSESLLNHSLTVEKVMRYFANKYGEDEEKWGIIGLLHDLDYEKYPDSHCIKVEELLREENYPEEYIRSIQSHGYGICPGVEHRPEEFMEKILYTIDELTGLITACVLVRPSRSIMDLKPKSVNKKWKDKGFASGVNRDTIMSGLEMLDMEKNQIIGEVIEAMKFYSDDLGLRGNL